MPGCISTTFRQLSTSSSSCSPSKGEDTTTTEDTTVIRCWQCNKVIDSIESPASDQPQSSNSSISTCTKCGSVQRIAGNVNFFRLFKIAERYDIDLGELRRQYLRLQATMHPDRNVNRSETDTDYSTDNSSLVNTAYRTLRDPYQRALYLLKHRYMITIGEEDTTSTTSSENSSSGNVLDPSVTSEPDLLLEILELNEEIELAAGDAAGLQALSAQLEETIARLVAGLRVAFDENDSGGEARRLVLRFSYYLSALEKVKAASLKA